jgi:hypothetical protein
MIVLKIEMWPSGREDRAREIGRTYIYNDGGTMTSGDYQVRVCRRGRFEKTTQDIRDAKGFTRTAAVTKYPRLAFNVWRLMIRALVAAFPEETPDR